MDRNTTELVRLKVSEKCEVNLRILSLKYVKIKNIALQPKTKKINSGISLKYFKK